MSTWILVMSSTNYWAARCELFPQRWSQLAHYLSRITNNLCTESFDACKSMILPDWIKNFEVSSKLTFFSHCFKISLVNIIFVTRAFSSFSGEFLRRSFMFYYKQKKMLYSLRWRPDNTNLDCIHLFSWEPQYSFGQCMTYHN